MLSNKQKAILFRKRHPLKWRCSALYLYAQKRVKGLTKHPRPEIWLGLTLCSKSDFDRWFDTNIRLAAKLYRAYLLSGKKRGLALSIHRINSDIGYVPSNMKLVTVSDNSRLAAFLGHAKNVGLGSDTSTISNGGGEFRNQRQN